MFSGQKWKKSVYLSFQCYFPCSDGNHWPLPAVDGITHIGDFLARSLPKFNMIQWASHRQWACQIPVFMFYSQSGNKSLADLWRLCISWANTDNRGASSPIMLRKYIVANHKINIEIRRSTTPGKCVILVQGP